MKRILNNVNFCLLLILGLFLCLSCPVQAASGSDFTVSAIPVSAHGGTSLDTQITVTNGGADFEGTVRLIIHERYGSSTAYDTAISLPAGSTKQFTVQIPAQSLTYDRQTAYVCLLDGKGRKVYEEDLLASLFATSDTLAMGILSDRFSDLTYLDLGGTPFYFYNDNFSIRTLQMNATDLTDQLSLLEFLVIDSYDTSVLPADTIDAISDWVNNGGILLIGTGADGYRTLSDAISQEFNVSVYKIYEPGNSVYGTYTPIDYSNLYYCELQTYLNSYDYVSSVCQDFGNGAVLVSSFAFADLTSVTDYEFWGYDLYSFTEQVLDCAASQSQRRYQYNGSNSHYDNNYIIRNSIGMIDYLDNQLNFTLLKIVVFVYILLLSPILYMWLKKKKRQEWYWVMVPALCLFFIVMVYVSGHGLSVNKTKVYSVSILDASGDSPKENFMRCYDSRAKKWSIKLSADTILAGPMCDQGYSYSSESDFFNMQVSKDSDQLRIGYIPETPFENVNLYSMQENPECGHIRFTDYNDIVNNTGKDFAYIMVASPYDLYIFPGLKNGEKLDFYNTVPIISDTSLSRNNAYSDFRSEFSSMMYDIDEKKMTPPDDIGAIAALGCALGILENKYDQETFVIGVIPDYSSITDGNYTEVNYGCLYTTYGK